MSEAERVAALSPKNQSHYVERAAVMHTSTGNSAEGLQVHTSPLTQEVLAVLAQSIVENIDQLDGKDCYRMIMGLGNLGLLTSSALVLLTARLNRTIRELRLEEVVDLAKQLVRADMVEGGVPLFVLVSRTVSMKLSLATGQDLVRLATAFADAGITDVAFFDRLGVHLSGIIHTLTVGVLVEALVAFARLCMRHDLLLLRASDVLSSKIGQLDAEQLCRVAFVYGRFEQVHPNLHEALEHQMGKMFVLSAAGRSTTSASLGQLSLPSLCDLTISVALLDLQWVGQRAFLEEMLNAVDWDDVPMPGRVCAAMARLKASPPLSAFRRASASSTEVCDWLAACGDLAERGYSLDSDYKSIIVLTSERTVARLLQDRMSSALDTRDIAVVMRSLRLLPPSFLGSIRLGRGTIPPRVAVSIIYSRLLLRRPVTRTETQALCDDLDGLPIDLRDEDPHQLSVIKYMLNIEETCSTTTRQTAPRGSPHAHDILNVLGGPTDDGQRRVGCREGPFVADVVDADADLATVYLCLSGPDFAMDGGLSNYTRLRIHALKTRAGWPRVIPLSRRGKSEYKPWKKRGKTDQQDATAPKDDKQKKGDKTDNNGWGNCNTEPINMENEQWEMYYSNMPGLFKSREDFDAMKETMKIPLPVSIRINPSAPLWRDVANRCEELSKEPTQPAAADEDIDETKGRQKKAELKELKQWFVSQELRGCVARQEAVSMIPALFAQIDRPDLTVMDMCAAPGSKTCQMIESLSNTCPEDKFSIPEGLVLANDIEWKRANMLAHQVLRLNSPASGVVNFDASCFPVLWDEEGKQVLFDRVLCDVPCTSDGTMRKNPDIWREWKTDNSIAIHHRQFRILLRGLELAKPGGRVVYSTCSLNPIEDEAVVAAALARFEGKVKLVPGPQAVGGRPGLQTWTVSPPGDAATHIDKYEDTPEQYKMKMLSSMWPPTDESIKTQLTHCRRFFPHDLNAGGFFVAAFEKLSDDVVESAPEESTSTEKPTADQRRGGRREAKPICKEYFPCPKESLDVIREFYGITEDMLPSELLWCRKDQPKKVFLLSKAAVRMVNSKTRSPFRVANLGVRAFQLVEIKHPKDENAAKAPPNWRIGQDGAPALLPLLNTVAEDKRQVIEIPSLEALAQLLEKKEATLEELGCGDRKTLKPGGTIATLPSSFGVHGGAVAVACMLAQSGKVQCYMDKLQAGALLQAVKDAIAAKPSQADSTGSDGKEASS
ncbi:hypothetical protein FOZ60_002272 [Perkinsus olseni]|uniref:SAM-dependent MTase RsmB/NOP-type domain-containing protein n=2 Tax=Perkinsus olseni TaxID=32597 RepID=A0A7J6PKE2_PEROL|nr:hypothetical protein FOZ60_002272 [Perkinsus olseni]